MDEMSKKVGEVIEYMNKYSYIVQTIFPFKEQTNKSEKEKVNTRKKEDVNNETKNSGVPLFPFLYRR